MSVYSPRFLDVIRDNPQIAQLELIEITGLTRRGVEWNLPQLKVKGVIISVSVPTRACMPEG